MLTSKLCTKSDWGEVWYPAWVDRLRERAAVHRKQWEHVVIAQALRERGMLAPGRSGMGFGVGREALVPLFAREGCQITATDWEASGWPDSTGFSMQRALDRRGICMPEMFAARVTFRDVDMRSIPPDLRGFDFTWSACSLEHLGDLQAGMDFLHQQMACLRPGGWAVHTTEFNMSSNGATIERGDVVLFRKADIEELAKTLRQLGHRLEVCDYSYGCEPEDILIDVPPYTHNPHLRLSYMGYVVTSILLIIQAAP